MKTFEIKVDEQMLDMIAKDEELQAMEVPDLLLRAMIFFKAEEATNN